MNGFVDRAKIKIISGAGGDGAVAWRREKYVDKGGPAGGDGGKGGDVYLIGDENLTTLMDFKHKSVFKAQKGENGASKSCHGACGEDLVIRVPKGVIVTDLKTGKVIADIKEHGQKVLFACGGRGGRGNARFATPQKRAPQFCEPGEPATERNLLLELKLIADIGLLGMPNAGKSTFISVVSSAKPKIADYPFTTLVPNLGVVKGHAGHSFVIADIPGLIEGASEGTGLGFEFLRHVQRCRFLLHIVDISAENPLENYKKINIELEKFDLELSKRFQVVLLNKTDIIRHAEAEKILKKFKKINKNSFLASCVTHAGIEDFMNILCDFAENTPPPEIKVEIDENLNELKNDDSDFIVTKLNKNTYVVSGGKINRLAHVTDSRNVFQMKRFSNILDSMGVYDKLLEAGVHENDTVITGNIETVFLEKNSG